MTELNDRFYEIMSNAGWASMICTFVSVISYLQEATFDSWRLLFITWGMGFLVSMIGYFAFNIKKIINSGVDWKTAIAAVCGTIVPLVSLALGKVAYTLMA